MARTLKPKEVDRMTHASGVVVPILINDYLDAATTLTWTPVIEVHANSLDRFSITRMYLARTIDEKWRKLDFDCYERASRSELNMSYSAPTVELERLRISHEWYPPGDDRESWRIESLPYLPRAGRQHDKIVMAYTAEKWAALEAIKTALLTLRRQLETVLTSTQGLEQLQLAGSKAALLLQ